MRRIRNRSGWTEVERMSFVEDAFSVRGWPLLTTRRLDDRRRAEEFTCRCKLNLKAVAGTLGPCPSWVRSTLRVDRRAVFIVRGECWRRKRQTKKRMCSCEARSPSCWHSGVDLRLFGSEYRLRVGRSRSYST